MGCSIPRVSKTIAPKPSAGNLDDIFEKQSGFGTFHGMSKNIHENMNLKSKYRNEQAVVRRRRQKHALHTTVSVVLFLPLFATFVTRARRISPRHVPREMKLASAQQRGAEAPIDIDIWAAPSLVRVRLTDAGGITSSIKLS